VTIGHAWVEGGLLRAWFNKHGDAYVPGVVTHWAEITYPPAPEVA
jgi:hypothetical protein